MGARRHRSLGCHARAGCRQGPSDRRDNAQRLPFDDATFDAAAMISMLQHVEDRGAALAEAQRILRPGGRLVLMGFTGEDAATLWILDYFPSSRPWMEATHPPRAAILEHLPGARLLEFEFEDMEDASLASLSADPERLLQAAERGETSFFERMQREPSRRTASRTRPAPRRHRGRHRTPPSGDRHRTELDEALTPRSRRRTKRAPPVGELGMVKLAIADYGRVSVASSPPTG